MQRNNRFSLRMGADQLKRAFDYKGRTTRTAVLAFWAVMMIVFSLLTVLIMVVGTLGPQIFFAGFVTMFLLGYASMIPWASLFVRRLHDQNRSGWWVLLLLAQVTLHAGGMLMMTQGTEGPDFFVMLPVILLLQVVTLGILVFAFLPGTAGPNRFGPDPR